MEEKIKIKTLKTNVCPECGEQSFRIDPNFPKNHRQCGNINCLQEYFTDIDYSKNNKTKYYRMKYNGSQLVCEDLDPIFEEIRCLDIGDKIKIEVIELTDKQFSKLPEFDGF